MRIKDKIEEIDKYLEELYSFIPNDFNEYENDFKIKAACERYFERIIEAVIDLAFLFVRDKGLKKPEDDEVVFDILHDNDVISKELNERLKNAKGMRNIISHKYSNIDDNIVFESVSERLDKDVMEFIESLTKQL